MPQKLPKPALGRGRVQRAARRAFIASDGPIPTSVVVEAAYVRRLRIRGLPLSTHHYRRAWRALERIAERCGRSSTGSGRAWLWRLKGKA